MPNGEYVFAWKQSRRLFWEKEKVTGHGFMAEQNKMVLYLPNNGLREIANWSQCECKLGADWFLAQKQQAEQEAGQT